MAEFEMFPLKREDLSRLKDFTDRAIGAGYYSKQEIEDIFQRSTPEADLSLPPDRQKMCSFVLKNGDEISGVRFTFPPGRWSHGKGQGENFGLTPSKWPFAMNETGYFQSLFLDESVQGQGWGARLSEKSAEVLRTAGAKGIVCHSWKESPGGSSTKYLLKMGFQPITEHPLYWQHVNYNCTRCLKPPCQCTAIEMYYEIPREK
jgi:hypothetical protein